MEKDFGGTNEGVIASRKLDDDTFINHNATFQTRWIPEDPIIPRFKKTTKKRDVKSSKDEEEEPNFEEVTEEEDNDTPNENIVVDTKEVSLELQKKYCDFMNTHPLAIINAQRFQDAKNKAGELVTRCLSQGTHIKYMFIFYTQKNMCLFFTRKKNNMIETSETEILFTYKELIEQGETR
jgi:hypothetical protein